MEYHSAAKRSASESVLMRWMNLEPIIQSDVSQKEKQLSYTNTYGEGMATHSRILAWENPWTEEPGGLQSMALQSQT